MSVTKFIKPDKLITYLDNEIQVCLDEAAIYNIDNYGWLDAETVDREYEGYANWEMDPPSEYFNNKALKRKASDLEIELITSGADFLGLMRVCFLSIGQMLFYKKFALADPYNENHYFSLNCLDVALKLNMASDRIRNCTIIAATGGSVDTFLSQKGNKRYTEVFDRLKNILKERGIVCAGIISFIDAAGSIARKINKRRFDRNFLVHNIATSYACIQRYLLKSQQDNRHVLKNEEARFLQDGSPNRIDDLANFNIEWYKELIELGNYVFQIEYKIRNAA